LKAPSFLCSIVIAELASDHTDEILNSSDNLIDDAGLLNLSDDVLNCCDNLFPVDLAEHFHDLIHCIFTSVIQTFTDGIISLSLQFVK